MIDCIEKIRQNFLLSCCLFGWVSITGVDSGYWNCYNRRSVSRCYWFWYYGDFAR